MSDTGKQSPLGVNILGSLLQHDGFYINPKIVNLAGTSKINDQYVPGQIVNDTCLRWLTYALNAAWNKGTPTDADGISIDTYEAMINIGQSRIPALGNSPPPTYVAEDPSEVWSGEATSGYPIPGEGNPANLGSIDNLGPDTQGELNTLFPDAIDGEGVLEKSTDYIWTKNNGVWSTLFSYPIEWAGQGQGATWFPFDRNNPNLSASQWGWIRLIALQAWNEFNWNGQTPVLDNPNYQYFTQSFLAAQGFIDFSNKALFAVQDSKEFLQGVYSNMDDLTSSDITGVSLASRAFGQDLINLGKAIDLSTIATFGLPSNLLKNLKKNNALTSNLSLALLAAGFSPSNINAITSGDAVTLEQEQALYGAFSVITGNNLKEILITLNCNTRGITNLAELLSMKSLFPISYPSLTVPIYNTVPNPTNSKTYYLLFVNGKLNPQLIAPSVVEKTDPIIPPIPAPPPEPPPPELPIENIQELIEEAINLPQTLPPLPEVPAPPPQVPPPPEPPIVPTVVPPPPAPPSTGGGGGCVALESFVPLVEVDQKHNGREITKAWMLESGMKISLGTDSLQIVDGNVVKTLNDHQPCVRIVTSDGITLVCSTTAPILTKDKGFIPATEVYGKRVAVMRNGRTWFDEVVGLEDVGMKFVRVIDAGNNSFWAGERPGSFILHHNVPINDKYNYDKK